MCVGVIACRSLAAAVGGKALGVCMPRGAMHLLLITQLRARPSTQAPARPPDQRRRLGLLLLQLIVCVHVLR